jgi:imidazoleglycerol-phosphate dehydratase/histidinol-phosphatase
MNKKKILFIDRDGTIIKEPLIDFQIDSLQKLEFLPKVLRNLYEIRKNSDYLFVMVSNQDGLGTSSFPTPTFVEPHKKMLQILKDEGIEFDAEHIDPSFPHENSPNRKPRTGMLTGYFKSEYDLENSLVLGDRATDVELAKNLGCKAIWINDKNNKELEEKGLAEYCAFTSIDWDEIKDFILQPNPSYSIVRNTKETKISLTLHRDNISKTNINSGLKFFDHMLEQLARHSGCGLELDVKGDLEVDEHHTIEDVAIALGEAYNQLLGDKRGINRYGFMLPMDEALATAAIDFSGRPWFIWEVEFTREYVGDFPLEMAKHFFKSFSDNAKCNLHITVKGENDHHKLEGIFKAVARAIKDAMTRNANHELPSTKGIL